MTKQIETTPYKTNQLLLALLLLLVLIMPSEALAQINVSQKDLEAISGVREIALQAINTRDFSKIKPFLAPTFTITTVDNRVFHSADEFETYWNEQFNGPVKNINMKLDENISRTFLTKNIEVANGEAIATFDFTRGYQRTMAMRWTAVLQNVASQWKIQSLHFSSNLLDNPVLRATEKLKVVLAIAAFVGGLLLGMLVMFLWRRQPVNSLHTPLSPKVD